MDSQVMVSICCAAYNHEKYIRRTLDGFVSQVTNFKYEVIVNDDASPDKTAEIIREYEKNILILSMGFIKLKINTQKI